MKVKVTVATQVVPVISVNAEIPAVGMVVAVAAIAAASNFGKACPPGQAFSPHVKISLTMKNVLKKLIMNLNGLVLLPGYIIFILWVAIPEKAQPLPVTNKTTLSANHQPIQKIKKLWKIIILAIQ